MAQENDTPTSQSVLLNDQEQDQANEIKSVVPNVDDQAGSDYVTVHNVTFLCLLDSSLLIRRVIKRLTSWLNLPLMRKRLAIEHSVSTISLAY